MKISNLKNTSSIEYKIFSALLILVSAIAIPLGLLWNEGTDFKNYEFTLKGLGIFSLYAFIVMFMILSAIGVKGCNLTSEVTDAKIVNTYKTIQKAIQPFVLLTFAICLLYIFYLFWSII